jgi:hypothetical protein
VHLCISALLAGGRLGLRIRPGFYYRVHPGSAYQKGFKAHADRHRLRLHLAATHGWRIWRMVPVFPLLVLKSALVLAVHGAAHPGGRAPGGAAGSARSVEEPAILAR